MKIEPRTTKDTTVCTVAASICCSFAGGLAGEGRRVEASVDTNTALTPIYIEYRINQIM